jgi:ATP-dependent protease ClpP protease subunit
MGQETDHEMAEMFIKNLHMLEVVNKEPITIIMNNIGGDEFDGMAIYDAIRASECQVTIKVSGNAMSMGSIILQAADVRLMYPHAKFMIHYGTPVLVNSEGSAQNNYRWIEESKKFDKMMEDLFLSKIHKKIPDFKLSSLRKLLEFDTILGAEEALRYNFIDGIIGG